MVVAGSRGFMSYELLESSLKDILVGYRPSEIEIISGGARGADQLGERFARDYNCHLKIMPAEWDLYGKGAGYRRNADMAIYANSTDDIDGKVVCFWDGISKGTTHMINLAKKYGINPDVIEYNQ